MPLIGYLILFVTVGMVFILVHLVIGALLRPSRPSAEKQTIYECGEESIGSAWIQFDVRYYVVAFLFVVFDVEVIFFFPWAEIFGKANAVANAPRPETAADYRAYAAKVNELATTHVKGLNDRNDVHFAHYLAMAKLDDETLTRMREQQAGVAAKIRAGTPLTAEEVAIWRYDGFLLRGTMDLQAERQRLTETETNARTEFETLRESAHALAFNGLMELGVFFGVLLIGFAYLWRRGDLEWVRAQDPPPLHRPATEGSSPSTNLPTTPPAAIALGGGNNELA
jgi:NADH-quinone oxidoreductase subunit A